jgi:hypothetical protein
LNIRKKYPQNLPGEESEQIESHEETVAKDDLPNESMKTDKAMEFDSNKEILDNAGVLKGIAFKWTQRTLLFHFESRFCLCHQSEKYG